MALLEYAKPKPKIKPMLCAPALQGFELTSTASASFLLFSERANLVGTGKTI
jgi:hypothetical protein